MITSCPLLFLVKGGSIFSLIVIPVRTILALSVILLFLIGCGRGEQFHGGTFLGLKTDALCEAFGDPDYRVSTKFISLDTSIVYEEAFIYENVEGYENGVSYQIRDEEVVAVFFRGWNNKWSTHAPIGL